MAGGQGFEPRQAESESAVLPLDDPPAMSNGAHKIENSFNYVKDKSKGLEAQIYLQVSRGQGFKESRDNIKIKSNYLQKGVNFFLNLLTFSFF